MRQCHSQEKGEQKRKTTLSGMVLNKLMGKSSFLKAAQSTAAMPMSRDVRVLPDRDVNWFAYNARWRKAVRL